MVRDGREPQKPTLPFEAWKSLLQKDCELQDKLTPFQALGDAVLEVLWESGMKPTVEALMAEGADSGYE